MNSDAVFQIILSKVRAVVPALDGLPSRPAVQRKELGVGSQVLAPKVLAPKVLASTLQRGA